MMDGAQSLADGCQRVGIVFLPPPADGQWRLTRAFGRPLGDTSGAIMQFPDIPGGVACNSWRGLATICFVPPHSSAEKDAQEARRCEFQTWRTKQGLREPLHPDRRSTASAILPGTSSAPHRAPHNGTEVQRPPGAPEAEPLRGKPQPVSESAPASDSGGRMGPSSVQTSQHRSVNGNKPQRAFSEVGAPGETGSTTDDDRVELIRGDTIKVEPVRWLWERWLARGKLHILAGAPGTGKTTLALAMAATITRGGAWPDGSRADAGSVLIWSGEDDPNDTLAPRLLAMGADMGRVHFVRSVASGEGRRPFDPATDMRALMIRAAEIGDVRLLIVDPIVNAVAVDSHKNGEVRRALAPIVELASNLDCASLGISHFTKGTAGRDPVERVIGSLAFGALPRVVFATARIKEDDGSERRLFVRAKSNIGPDGGGFSYTLEQSPLRDHPGISASRLTWGAPIEGTARELLATAEAVEEASTEARDAAEWLRDLLEAGPLPAKEVQRAADQAGFAWRTVQRSMKKAGVKSERDRFGKDARYVWRLAHVRH